MESCCICAEFIHKERIPFGPETRANFVSVLNDSCKLLKLHITSFQEWLFIKTAQEPSLCCNVCYKTVLSLLESYKLIVKTQAKLKDLILEVESKVGENLERRISNESLHSSYVSCREIETNETQRVKVDNDWDTPSLPDECAEDDFFTTEASCPRKKRKIVVVSEEDENKNFTPAQPSSMFEAKSTSFKDTYRAEIATFPMEEEKLKVDTLKSKVPRKKLASCLRDGKGVARPLGKYNNLPFLIITDNLFLYKHSTFVEYSFTHLHCKAVNCTFQIAFDYFPSFQAMKDHLEECHRGYQFRRKAPVKCLVCEVTFPKQMEFREHFTDSHTQFHYSVANGICECCLRPTRYKNTAKHQYTHMSPEELAEARKLGIGPNGALALKDSEHSDRPFKCTHEGCTVTVKQRAHLKRHLLTHLKPEDRPDAVICSECGVKLVGKFVLRKHMQSFHYKPDPAENVVHCPICNKKFLWQDRSELKNHLRTHRGEKSVMCQECGKTFVSKSRLSSHIKTTHVKGEYPCTECGKHYEKVKSFHKHWKAHHGRLPFPGSRQQRSFSGSEDTRFYSRSEEKKAKELVPQRKWPCEQCDVVCVSKQSLQRHVLNIHQGENVNSKLNATKTRPKNALPME